MPFSDVHLQLHSIRATELRAEAAAYRSPSPAPRWQTRLGWLLVEYGLRLVNRPARVRLSPV
ncbi:hypothetical protein ACIBBB_33890 [Streptomyces sp. NPDC051217]|uniref:hypothetical protein n=1 Tax=Streptomyces sp. NPDC051217 TaxID=3365644 RepID=UPI0037B6A779